TAAGLPVRDGEGAADEYPRDCHPLRRGRGDGRARGDLIGNIPQVMTVLNLALPAVTAAVLAGSCFLSVRIYRRRHSKSCRGGVPVLWAGTPFCHAQRKIRKGGFPCSIR